MHKIQTLQLELGSRVTGDVILAWLRKPAVAGFCELTIGLCASKSVFPGTKRRQSSVGDRDFAVAPFVICGGRADNRGHALGIWELQ